MNLTKTHQYFISLTVATVFFLLNRNIWLNSIVSMVLIFLLCERKIQIKSVALSMGISLFVGIVDYILQYILVFYTVSNIIFIIAEDLFCFLLFYLILIFKPSHRKQTNYRIFIFLFIIAVAIRSIIHICHNITLIENQNNFIEYIQMLSYSWIPFLGNISYFVAVIGLLYNNTTNKETD